MTVRHIAQRACSASLAQSPVVHIRAHSWSHPQRADRHGLRCRCGVLFGDGRGAIPEQPCQHLRHAAVLPIGRQTATACGCASHGSLRRGTSPAVSSCTRPLRARAQFSIDKQTASHYRASMSARVAVLSAMPQSKRRIDLSEHLPVAVAKDPRLNSQAAIKINTFW